MSTIPPGLAKARGKARRLAMQAIYQWQMTADDFEGIALQYVEDTDMKEIDADYFHELLKGVVESVGTIDTLLEKHMERSAESVDPVERAIIRIAAYEFINRLDVPYRVVLNEAVMLAKKFCAANSHSFINGVLDKVARDVRSIEVAAV
jgi:N utilization substance protein B